MLALLLPLACSQQLTPALPIEGPHPDGSDDSATSRADDSAAETGDSGHAPGPCDEDAPAPDPVTFPATIDTLTVTVRTDDADETDGTADANLELCLSARSCFPLAPGDGSQIDAGSVGVWSFEGVALPRTAVDRVELRTSDGEDHWAPSCVDLRFDGEPVYCEEGALSIGNATGETMDWTDPEGLHQACTTCWDGPLAAGPMVGAVTPDSARIWVRTDATREVALRIGRQPDLSDARIAAWAQPSPADDFTATLDAHCLEPGTTYSYDVLVDGAVATRSTGTFTTPPADASPGAWRLAFGSCAKTPEQPIFLAIAASEPDLFAFVGDNHYGNTSDLDLSRWYYRTAIAVPERLAFLAHTPTLAVWDDHDYAGNDLDGFAAGKAQALRSFEEYWGNPAFGTEDTPGVYFSSRWGDVDLFFLDDRYYRGVDGTLLGGPQHDWLVSALEASTATFKLVIDGSEWSFTGAGDSWADFPDERDALFETIRDEGISGVLLMSGDIHRGELRLLDNPGGYAIPELISSPLANENTTCPTDDELLDCYDDGPVFITVDIDTTATDPTVTASIMDLTGTPVAAETWTLSQLR